MLESFLSVASAVTGVFLVMSMGGLARHWKWFTSEVDKSLAGFTSNVLMPALFFSRIMSDDRLSMHLDASNLTVEFRITDKIGNKHGLPRG